MVHAALLLLMLEAVSTDLVSTISLKRSTQNLQLSTRSPADYPISYSNSDQNGAAQRMTRSAIRDRCTAEKCFFASTNIQNKAALRELRDCEV
jgi:hypothetical protein